jgi:hypothetical protein
MNAAVTILLTNIATNSSDPIAHSIQNINNTTLAILQSETNNIDPNWFYSSSAQCAAAIVGLMGAFLVTKIVNQKAFLNQTKNEISDYDGRMALIENEIRSKIAFINTYEFEEECKKAKRFLYSYRNSINLDNPPIVDQIYEEAQKKDELKDVTLEAFKMEYNPEYLAELREYNKEITNYLLKDYEKEKKIDVDNPPDPNNVYEIIQDKFKNIGKAVFEESYNNYIENKKNERKKHQDSGLFMKDTLSVMNNRKMSTISQAESKQLLEDQRLRSKTYSDYKVYVATKQKEISFYNNVIHEKQMLLISDKDLDYIKKNLILLFGFSIVGVFLPLGMLLSDKTAMLNYRSITFGAMFIGWVFIVLSLWSVVPIVRSSE